MTNTNNARVRVDEKNGGGARGEGINRCRDVSGRIHFTSLNDKSIANN